MSPSDDELILLNRLCWLDRYPVGWNGSKTCWSLEHLGLLERTADGRWIPTASGRSVAAASVADGFREWIPKG